MERWVEIVVFKSLQTLIQLSNLWILKIHSHPIGQAYEPCVLLHRKSFLFWVFLGAVSGEDLERRKLFFLGLFEILNSLFFPTCFNVKVQNNSEIFSNILIDFILAHKLFNLWLSSSYLILPLLQEKIHFEKVVVTVSLAKCDWDVDWGFLCVHVSVYRNLFITFLISKTNLLGIVFIQYKNKTH